MRSTSCPRTHLDVIDREGRGPVGKTVVDQPDSGHLRFVDRRGGRLCVASAEELAMMVLLERLHRDDVAFYGAMRGGADGPEAPVKLKA
ncbi:hypothetical protein WCN79_06500 [Xanthomonas axonopodis pv. vasculorum]|nr:hypothetical protein [Xanthomonas axonopodis]PPV09706.1 hypothetical protein XavaCFBP5823_12855 [Xanthomonas axonopodis pv. vasculorum]QKD88609.1 hypothetical protein XAV_16755 [Xanthomonas axonopodis pv. vasculorum]